MEELHIGLIPDGNRRFALKRNISLESCYNNSVEKALEFADWCCEEGAKSVTMYAFSLENFQRSKEEISILYGIFCRMFDQMMKDKDFHYKVLIRGNRDVLCQHFDRTLLEKIDAVEKHTCRNEGFTIVFLLGYAARDEFINDFQSIEKYPKVNLLIRTAGELRTSNFPFSPDAYFYSCPRYFPLFTRTDLRKAIKEGWVFD